MPPKVISPRRALVIECLLFLAYAFFSASWMVGSIVTTDMCQEFGLTALPSSVNNAISLAKLLGNFVAAWILLKLGPKKTVAFSCLLTCSVVAGAFATNLSFFVVTRFLLGFGGAVLMICLTPYGDYCFEPRQQSLWIGVNNAGPNTGGSQFFMNFVPTPFLNKKHTVFGRIVDGMEVLSDSHRIDPEQETDVAPDKILEAKILRGEPEEFEKLPAR